MTAHQVLFGAPKVQIESRPVFLRLMSTIQDLPDEILEFLSTEPPQSLIVRGPPGTGKTLLSLALLCHYPGRRVYVSSRVSTKELQREFPWLESKANRIEVVDAAGGSGGVREKAELVAYARHQLSDPAGSDELRSLWLPEPIQETWSRLDPRSPTIVVIDSWDALIERYLGFGSSEGGPVPDRPEIERILVEQMAKAPVFLVLVTERDEVTQLDYLLNGVVQTRWVRTNSRVERWLSLSKLRGVRLDMTEYPFTLDGGRFACITPFPPEYRSRLTKAVPDPDPQPGLIWPGNGEFAAAFGRLPVRRLTLIEKEPLVPDEAVRTVVRPIIAHAVEHGGRVVQTLPPEIFPDEMWSSYRDVISLEQFHHQVRIGSVITHVTDEVRPSLLPRPPPAREGPSGPLFPQALQFLQDASPSAPNLLVSWLDGVHELARMQGSDLSGISLPGVAMGYLSTAPIHVIFIGTEDDPFGRGLRAMASIRLRFRERNGRVFIAGDKPITPQFVLADSEGADSYNLVRVV